MQPLNGAAARPQLTDFEIPSEVLIFGRTPAMAEIRQQVLNVAEANVPVLICGESGTGKEVMARLIHAWSTLNAGSFVKVHCPAIPANLLESELFGFEEGAFTGATRAKPGRVESAQGGTLFLDEIAEMDPSLQAKLLHFLQDGRISHVGGEKELKLDIRLICATCRSLEDEIAAGRFRQDLFYRINVVSLRLPPLRERVEDLPELVGYFVELYAARYHRPPLAISSACLDLMRGHTWPGNLRELENLINRCVVLGSEDTIRRDIVGSNQDKLAQISSTGANPLRKIAKKAAYEAERKVILQVLQSTHGSRKEAAKALKISYRALLYKLKNVGIPPKRGRWDSGLTKVSAPH